MTEIAAFRGGNRWDDEVQTVNDSMEDYKLCNPCTNDTNNCKRTEGKRGLEEDLQCSQLEYKHDAELAHGCHL